MLILPEVEPRISTTPMDANCNPETAQGRGVSFIRRYAGSAKPYEIWMLIQQCVAFKSIIDHMSYSSEENITEYVCISSDDIADSDIPVISASSKSSEPCPIISEPVDNYACVWKMLTRVLPVIWLLQFIIMPCRQVWMRNVTRTFFTLIVSSFRSSSIVPGCRTIGLCKT